MVTNEPLIEPTAFGVKLIRLVHEDPGSSVAALEFEVSCGQVELSPIVNPAVMLGSKPVAGTGNVSAALPIFVSITVCGLSLLVEPTAVDAKLSLGGSEKSIFTTALCSLSSIKRDVKKKVSPSTGRREDFCLEIQPTACECAPRFAREVPLGLVCISVAFIFRW